jgi:NAD(P)-dependent dehydrogenase (short-subunit alcohol dehydrogenase family)
VTSSDFRDKTVLVTGAASGIGRETALAFAERGARVQLVDIDGVGQERTALLCRALGAEATTYVADVSVSDDMRRVSEAVHERVPAVDVLVNNAGVAVLGSFVETDLADWDWIIGVNVKGVVHGCHFFVPKMIQRGAGGAVVNVASASGLAAPRRMSAYGATKFAVVGFSDVLRAELKEHGITVATICPGIIDTPITRNARVVGDIARDGQFRERVQELYRKRNYTPARVARAIVNAVERGKGVTPVTPEAWISYLGKRWWPSLIDAILGRDIVTKGRT